MCEEDMCTQVVCKWMDCNGFYQRMEIQVWWVSVAPSASLLGYDTFTWMKIDSFSHVQHPEMERLREIERVQWSESFKQMSGIKTRRTNENEEISRLSNGWWLYNHQNVHCASVYGPLIVPTHVQPTRRKHFLHSSVVHVYCTRIAQNCRFITIDEIFLPSEVMTARSNR